MAVRVVSKVGEHHVVGMNRASVLRAATRFGEDFVPGPLTPAPSRHLAVLACMDARLDLFRLLGLQIGDAHVIRNAGGRATDDAIRSLTLSTHRLGTREIVVIHHTDCGLHGTTNDALRACVEGATGADASQIDFLPFADVRESVVSDVTALRACPLLPSDVVVWGAVYDVERGTLTTVD